MFALSCPLSLMSYNCRIQWLQVEGPPPPLSPHPGHSPGQGTRNLQCRDAFSPNPYYPSGGMVFDIALSIRECRFPVKPRAGRNTNPILVNIRGKQVQNSSLALVCRCHWDWE